MTKRIQNAGTEVVEAKAVAVAQRGLWVMVVDSVLPSESTSGEAVEYAYVK